MYDIDKKLQEKIFNIVKTVEIFIALILTIAIIIYAFNMIVDVISLLGGHIEGETFDKLLSHAFSLIIGIEFVKMICRYTPSIVIEVILFTVARYLILNHSSAISTLFGVVAIAGIFAIRKYLFSNFDDKENTAQDIEM